MKKTFSRWLAGSLLLCVSLLASAQNAPKLDNAQLDQLLAPVALYPDAVLSQLFMASTYPDDVKEAADWSRGHQDQSGDAAVKAVDAEPWDPSVKSLVGFPSVMDLMGRQPDWVVQVGNAFLDQPDDVMDSVQRLRRQAQAAGSLKSNEQQTVTVQSQGPSQIIEIAPANPQVVYVPQYNPTAVYGAWPYPAYPPYYYPPYPGSVFATSLVAGIGFGLGVAAIDSMWGGFDWGRNDVNINVNRYNNINVNNRLRANQTNFQHNAARRGSTPYNNAANRQRFDSQRQAGLANRGGNLGGARAAASGSRDAARDRAAQSMQSRTGQSIAGHEVGGGRAGSGAARDRAGQGAGGARDRVAQQGGGAARDRVGQGSGGARESAAARQSRDHSAAMNRSRAANHDSAFRDAGNGAKVRQQAQRGNVQRANVGGGHSFSGGGARPSGGGAHMGGGGGRAGGGGHMGGGRRR
ncbi:DUF3300 domain-containing protein [Variovorax sp.]|uniref:DUF3300 domain-containing protein n=1 Tax=Variovorax sp. TaxID=1871043 RepID=UPI002D68BD47|nr:DUF3300 domain-containing protein [Variovorax sp.]HYP86207.1 DUF3300 domain-containing protein [Variovorax sp.]